MIISVILIVGGDRAMVSVELLHTNGTWLCSLPNLPSNRRAHSQTGLISCGTWDSDTMRSCVTFSSGSWEVSHTLAQDRRLHSAWVSPHGIMLIGGHDNNAVAHEHSTGELQSRPAVRHGGPDNLAVALELRSGKC